MDIAAMLSRLGIDAKQTGRGQPTWAFQRGSATIEINLGEDFVVAHSKMLETVQKDDVELLRRLMQANLLMKGAFFCIEGDGNVRIAQVCPMDGLDDAVFEDLLANLSRYADQFDDVLQGRAWEKR